MDDSDKMGQEVIALSDWHPADIQAALKKRGLSLSGLSAANGYHATAAGKALKQSWPALETVIADAIGAKPHELWPSRYPAGQSAAAQLNQRQSAPSTPRTVSSKPDSVNGFSTNGRG